MWSSMSLLHVPLTESNSREPKPLQWALRLHWQTKLRYQVLLQKPFWKQIPHEFQTRPQVKYEKLRKIALNQKPNPRKVEVHQKDRFQRMCFTWRVAQTNGQSWVPSIGSDLTTWPPRTKPGTKTNSKSTRPTVGPFYRQSATPASWITSWSKATSLPAIQIKLFLKSQDWFPTRMMRYKFLSKVKRIHLQLRVSKNSLTTNLWNPLIWARMMRPIKKVLEFNRRHQKFTSPVKWMPLLYR